MVWVLLLVACDGGGGQQGGQGGMDADDAGAVGGHSGMSSGGTGGSGNGGAAGVMVPVGGGGGESGGGAGGAGEGGAGGEPDAGCTPSEDACDGIACGSVPNGCGEQVECGGCDDGELCDDHACILEASCEGCAIDGECVAATEGHPSNPCLLCLPETNAGAWSANAGAGCGFDDNPCLPSGACSAAGECERVPSSVETPCGEQTICAAMHCNGSGTCVREIAEVGMTCSEPANACELADTCDEAGECADNGVLELGDACGDDAHCVGAAGAPECSCDEGYVLDGDACVDRDECALDLDDCDRAPMACDNDVGSYHCACPPEFTGDGEGSDGCSCSRDDWSPSCKPWTSVSMDYEHACAISEGDLYCWGNNQNGVLGVGDVVPRERPTRVGTRRDWEHVSAGFDRTCGIAGGELLCWGNNGAGWLGHGGDGLTPGRVGTDSDWIAVEAGGSASCGMREGGALYCWGWGEHGNLGQGNTASSSAPLRVLPALSGFDDLAMSATTVCATRAGSVYCWGTNSWAIGDGLTADRLSPYLVPGITGVTDVDVHSRTCVVHDGSLTCWGFLDGATPTPIAPELDDIVSVNLGIAYRCVTRATGETLCWGYGAHGQLGVGDALIHDEPTTLPGAWQALATGSGTVCGISNGSLSCWGSNAYGVRGTGFSDFGRVGSAADWSTVGLGYAGGCGLRGSGELFCWGRFVAGTTDGYTPVRIGSASDWSQLSVGEHAQCAIRDGELYCWGEGANGALGLGAITEASAPARVGSDDDWLGVSIRTDHACGIRNGGDLYCWGSNTYRALGTASASNSNTPVLVSTGGWQSIAVGDQHSCGVRSGQLHCWGSRAYGAVGDGAPSGSQTTPLQIGDRTSWTRAFASRSTSGALDASGALYVWGFGALGMPASQVVPVPTQLGTATGWTGLQSAAFHSCGVRAGMLYCWGGNHAGELGQPSIESLATPTRVGDSSTWQSVTVSRDSSCAIDAGALYCFGSNAEGKLASSIGLQPMPVLNVSALE